jgi:hypothetical protein
MSNEATHYVEVVDSETGKVVETLGPMTERKADRVDQGIQINMNHERYFTRTGTREALDKEAAERAADAAEPASPAAQVAADLGLKAEPGWEAELEDGQGLAVLAAASAPIGPARAARLQEDTSPAARAEEKRRRHQRMIEDKAAELLAAGLEFAADPRNRMASLRLRGAALGYGDARGIKPKRRKTTITPTKKKGPRR